jgi:hypothetical protein
MVFNVDLSLNIKFLKITERALSIKRPNILYSYYTHHFDIEAKTLLFRSLL